MTGRKYKLSSSASRRRSTVTEPVTPTLERHISLHKQMSQLTIKTQEESVSLEKKQEEWDKEIPEVSYHYRHDDKTIEGCFVRRFPLCG